MLAWGIALGIRLSGKSSAESAIQSVPGDWRMAHMMIEFVQEVNRAFSAGALFVPRILGRCPRLAVNCAFGDKLVPVARIVSLPRRSLGGSGRLGSTASQCAEDSAHYSAKFAFRTQCFSLAKAFGVGVRCVFASLSVEWERPKAMQVRPFDLLRAGFQRTPKVRRLPDENGLVIGTSSFLRHSTFVLRHFFRDFALCTPSA